MLINLINVNLFLLFNKMANNGRKIRLLVLYNYCEIAVINKEVL